MRDPSLDEVLYNIGSEIKKSGKQHYDDDISSDPQDDEEITIDLGPLNDDDSKTEEELSPDLEKDSSGGIAPDRDLHGKAAIAPQAGHTKNDNKITGSELTGTMPQSVRFAVKGSKSWNTREPYIISINDVKLKENFEDLNVTIYFNEDLENELSLQGKIKLALMRNITGDRTEVLTRYKEFIFKSIILLIKDFQDIYNLQGDKFNLFIYHAGVYTVYRILINHLQNLKIGYCYKKIGKSKVTKFLPLEYLKVAALNWFEDNINICSIPFDGIHEYNELKRAVTGKYYAELEKINKKTDEIIARQKLNADKKFNRDDYLRSKWDELFGPANIIIYNRFIERTIFKFSERLAHR